MSFSKAIFICTLLIGLKCISMALAIGGFLSTLVGVLSILVILWMKFLKENRNNSIDLSIMNENSLSFDYIIVGAGTAGSVVASILSGNLKNKSILLVEAGGEAFSWTTNVPLLATLSQKTIRDWAFVTTPQKYSSKGIINQQQCLPRGRGMGGSSQINYLLHYGGELKDFENWSKMGLKSWDFKSMKLFLDTDKNYPIKIWSIPKNYSYLSEAFDLLKTEFNNENLNFHLSQYTIDKGRRSNVYQIYLQPNFNNHNLKFLCDVVVDKITFDTNKKAKGITFKNENRNFEIFANREIILSAGAYQSPSILQRSGIGSKEILTKFNINTVLNSPNVGEHLHDHFNLPLYVSIEKIASITVDKILNPFEIWKYIRTGEGHFSNFGVIGNIDTKNDSYGISIFGTGAINENALMSLSNFKLDAFRNLFPKYYNSSQEGFVVLSTCLYPRSRGNVKIRSTNPRDAPFINPKYVKFQDDIFCMIRAVRTAITIIQSKSFEFLQPKIHWPRFEECLEFVPNDKDFETNTPNDSYLECIIRYVGLGSHHPGGTCSMGDNNSKNPLDETLKVRGVNGLRVVDASIFPAPISGTPNSILISVSRRAAEMILSEME